MKLVSLIRGRAPAIALEVGAIVFSILLAFFIQAWWEARNERVRARAYVLKLIEEFEVGRQELETDLRVRAQMQERWLQLLRTPPDSPDSSGTIIASMNIRRFYTPVHAVFDDLISSGALHLIRSDTLRRAILQYAQERERVATVEDTEDDLLTQAVLPYLVARAELVPWLSQTRLDSLSLQREPPQRDPHELVRDPTFRNILFLRWERADVTQRYSMRLHAVVLEVLRLLQAEAAS